MAISASDVKKLREMTGAGMMDCKKALDSTDGDFDKAVDLLREKGLATAQKKSSRVAAEGLTDLIISEDHSVGAICEVNSETDFVAKNKEFIDFVRAITETACENKINNIDELKKATLKGESESIEDVLTKKIAKIGENMTVRRVAVEKGLVYGYLHGGKIAAMVNFDSDIAPDKLEEIGKDISMQIASMHPLYISSDDVDEEYISHEREVLLNQAKNENEEEKAAGGKGKPDNILEKMVEGRLHKELKAVCLLEQAFVKDPDITVANLLEKTAKDLGGKISIKSMTRFEVGEGIEKKEEDFQEEVQKQINGTL